MPDTFTDSLGLILQETGGNDNTWGENLNDQAIQYIEDALVGRTAISTTGGTTVATQAQLRPRFIDVTGTLVSDATLQVLNKKNNWIINNGTSGDFALLVKTSGGSAISIPAGCSVEVYCDGSNGVVRMDRDNVGMMAFFGNSSVPNGWFECDGSTKSRAGRGLDLFGKVSTTWGTGNGSTTFTLPDGKTAGRFLRSRTASVTVGTSQADQNLAHGHSGSTASSTTTTTGTTSTVNDHSHGGSTGSTQPTVSGGTFGSANSSGTLSAQSGAGVADVLYGNVAIAIQSHTHSISADGSHNHTLNASSVTTTTVTIASNGGSEARPVNLSAILCIKY